MPRAVPENFSPNRDWTKGSIDKGTRGLNYYEAALGISRGELVGKIILDLGSSQNALLAQELKLNGIECSVISLSPDYSSKKHQPIIKTPEIKPVAAIAQELPFKENTFDFILDVGGPGVHAVKREQLEQWLSEIIRVAKKGGKIITVASLLNLATFIRANSNLSVEKILTEKLHNTGFFRETIIK